MRRIDSEMQNYPGYLQNGQTVSELAELRKQLSEDPETVLSVCFDSQPNAGKSIRLCRIMEAGLAECHSRLQESECRLRRCIDHIPAPSGFFHDEKMYRAAVRAVSCFRSQSERLLRAFRSQIHSLTFTGDELRKEYHRSIRNLRNCELTLAAAENCPLSEERSNALKEVVSDTKKALAFLQLLLEVRQDFSDGLRRFSESALTAFHVRLKQYADLTYGGEQCDLAALRTLLGELLYACQKTQTELLRLRTDLSEHSVRFLHDRIP